MVRKNLGLESEKTRQTTLLDFLFLNDSVCQSNSPKTHFRQTKLNEFSVSAHIPNNSTISVNSVTHSSPNSFNSNGIVISAISGVAGISSSIMSFGGINLIGNVMGFLGMNYTPIGWTGENTVSILDEYLLLALNRSLLRVCRRMMEVEENSKSENEFNEKVTFIVKLFVCCLILSLFEIMKKKGNLKEKNLAKTFLIKCYVQSQIKVLGCRKRKRERL